jgi:Flp pilus assembly protein CpaB
MTQARPQIQPPSQQAIGGTKLVIIAVILALVTVVLTNIYIDQVKRKTQEETFSVFVLNRSVRVGDKFGKDDVSEIRVPKSLEPNVRRLNVMDETTKGNRIATADTFRAPAPQGALLTHDLFIASTAPTADSKVSPGKRLMTLPVNSRSQPTLWPGNYVDIVGPFSINGKLQVRPVIERVRVLAVGAFTLADADAGIRYRVDNYQNISIELTPPDCDTMSMVQKAMVGDFELRLRNPSDDKATQIAGVPTGTINPELAKLVSQGIGVGRTLPKGVNVTGGENPGGGN